MELAKDLFLVIGRILTILPLLLVITLLMGKRSIGELPIFDFLVVITLGAVVGADIADPKISHIHTVVAIIAIALLQRFVARLVLNRRKIVRLITFEPTIVIKDGQFLKQNIKDIRYSIDNILQMLREREIFDIRDVHLGIIEANGKLTVHKQPHKDVVTAADMGIKKVKGNMTYPVIIEGKLYGDVLQALSLSEQWLKDELKRRGIRDLDRVFFASVSEKKEIHVSLAKDVYPGPPVHH